MKSSRLKDIFHQAVEMDAMHRNAFLEEACGSDRDLREQSEALLRAYTEIDDFLQIPATPISAKSVVSSVLQTEEDSAIGKMVGSYRIVKEIARGGMGTVYMAERDDRTFEKKVAIKLLRHGLGNQSVVSRFERERQILADLEHPGIARLIDGGATDNGLPYFVMEYVEGAPVTQYCEDNHLTVNERLRLFQRICAAVEYAHHNAVIHRDIKPANILVTPDGIPKLLDFGIAKVTSGNSFGATTATGLQAMTPEYASPEQMRGATLKKTSDVYSLGVLLYELLTGELPYSFANKSPYEIVRSICEEDPPRPSAALDDPENVQQDLDNVVLKALSKRPERRYGTVREFSDDVDRYLKGARTKAKPRSFFHRIAGMYERRRTAVLSIAATSMLVLIVGLVTFLGPRTQKPAASSLISTNETSRTIPTERKKGGSTIQEARELYRLARLGWEQRQLDSIRHSVTLYQRAIEKDPSFALAYAGLSDSYFLLSVWGDQPASDAFPKARIASLKAIELAPDAAEGHLSLAVVHWLYDYDWKAAEDEFQMALRLDPTFVRTPHWYGLFLAEMGRFKEAVESEKMALTLEPTSLPVNGDFARVLYYARRYEESLEQYRKTVSINPGYPAFYAELQELYEEMDMTEEMMTIGWSNGYISTETRDTYLTGGIDAYRRKSIEIMTRSKPLQWHVPFRVAQLHAQLGENDYAFKYLAIAYEQREHRMAQLKVSPKFDNLRSDPRFAEWLRRLNLD